MKLKGFAASLDDVDEAYRDLYVKDGDRYRLDADGVEDVSGLKSALEKEKDERRKAKAQLAKFADIDLDEWAEYKKAMEEAEKKAAKDEGDFKALEEQLKAKHAETVSKLEERNKALEANLRTHLVDAAATKAILAAGGVDATVTLLLPHVSRRTQVVDEDGTLVARVVTDDGKVRIGDDKGNPMTVDQLVSEMKESDAYGQAFPPQGKSGGGSRPSGQAGTGGTVVSTDSASIGQNLEKIAKGEIQVISPSS